MKADQRLLVSVDASKASERAVDYVGKLLSESDALVRLLHIEEPIGPYYVPVQGGDGSDATERPAGVEGKLLEEAERRSRPVLDRMTGILRERGVDAARIETSWLVAAREDDLVVETLRLARDQGFTTVVVGRTALPWYRDLFHHHFGDRLVHKGEGLAVWVVE